MPSLLQAVLADPGDSDVLITTIGGIIVAVLGLIGTFLGLLLREQHQVKVQVKNSHEINFRDDIDGKHDETGTILSELRKTFRNDLGDIRLDIREVRGQQHDDREENRRRFAEIERTRPTPFTNHTKEHQ